MSDLSFLWLFARATLLRWTLIWCLAFLVLASFAGCATMSKPVAVQVPVEVPVEVKIAVPVPCMKKADAPKLPALPTREALRALPDYELLLTIEQLRNELSAYALRADAIITACAR